ncbi:hypothetical protein ACLKA7_004622 [Drosophila subpalustris]
MEKFCFVVPLKWGMLIIAILDTILDILGFVFLYLEVEEWNSVLKVNTLFFLLHLLGCILLVVSIWTNTIEYAFSYLITGAVRFGIIAWFIVDAFIDGWVLVGIIHTIIVVFGIFFLFCVDCWYSKLKNK